MTDQDERLLRLLYHETQNHAPEKRWGWACPLVLVAAHETGDWQLAYL
ncbi:MAG: hypothetical protein R2867_44650 [Caldilineaceae bacterium]